MIVRVLSQGMCRLLAAYGGQSYEAGRSARLATPTAHEKLYDAILALEARNAALESDNHTLRGEIIRLQLALKESLATGLTLVRGPDNAA